MSVFDTGDIAIIKPILAGENSKTVICDKKIGSINRNPVPSIVQELLADTEYRQYGSPIHNTASFLLLLCIQHDTGYFVRLTALV